MAKRAILVGFVLLAFVALSWGQVITGAISGTVKDASGALLPGVSMEIQNTDTGVTRMVTTDERGYYIAPNLNPGNYQVSASLPGFQTEIRRGFSVNVGQTSVIDLTLKVGALAEKIEVTADAPLVETANAVVAGLVSEKQVHDLPLNNRSLIELAPLQAGIVVAVTTQPGASKGMGTKLAISGTRYNANLFQIDGASINDLAGAAGSATNNLMGAETIKEFNVVINGYSAEYGNHSGGVFNAVTKSGTNTLHGSLFEFIRNDHLDAARWEDNKNGKAKPSYKRNQFGGSLGGPLIRDRTFFFGSYEGLRENIGEIATYTVPGEALRRGDIQTLDANGNFVFARHRDVAPQVQPYLDFYPLPSSNGLKRDGGTQDLYQAIHRPAKEDYWATRFDHKLTDKDSIFGRYTFSNAYRVDSVDLAATNFNRSRNQSSTIGYTRIISPAIVNQFILAWSRNNLTDADAVIHPDVISKLPSTYKFTSFPTTIGAFTVQNLTLTGFGNEGARNYLNNVYQVKDDLFYTAAKHGFKFGFNMQRNFLFALRHFQGQGTFAFQNGGTACGAGTCNGVDNFLRGVARNFTGLTRTSQDTSYIRNELFGMYVQDDWRLRSNLTVNLGLRYEFITVPEVEGGRVSTLRDFTKPNQTMADLLLGNPTFLNPSLKNFAPRIGIVWDPKGDGKTSIRTGVGIFHDQINPGTYNFSFLASPPYYIVGNILGAVPTAGTMDPARGRPLQVGEDFANNPHFPDSYYTQQTILAAQPNLEGFQYDPKQPTLYKWSFEIQRELPGDVGVTANYSGNRGVHLFRVNTAMNGPVGQSRNGRIFIASNAPLLSPGFGRVRPRHSDVTSDYHAFLFTVKKRVGRVQFQSSYTFSKTVDDSSNFTGSSDWDNGSSGDRFFNVKDRGLAAFDIRHAFITNASYQLPGKSLTGVPGVVLGAWQLSSILSMRSGNPFDALPGVNIGNFTNLTQYPDRVGPIHYNPRNPDHYFDPSAFALAPGYAAGEAAALGGAFVGNAARGSLIGPGSATLDMVLEKRFRISERANVQFRSEAYNILNRVNFGTPNGNVFLNGNIQRDGTRGTINPQVGQITTTRGNPRQLQFGLRIEF